jgi:hypothetical protein
MLDLKAGRPLNLITEQEEMKSMADGVAIAVNRFLILGNAVNMRFIFAEKLTPEHAATFRAAVVVDFQDAVNFRNLLNKVIDQVGREQVSLEGQQTQTPEKGN